MDSQILDDEFMIREFLCNKLSEGAKIRLSDEIYEKIRYIIKKNRSLRCKNLKREMTGNEMDWWNFQDIVGEINLQMETLDQYYHSNPLQAYPFVQGHVQEEQCLLEQY